MTPDELAELLPFLPKNISTVLKTAGENGWQLNGKGVTLCIRLDHPTDELAVPVYATWEIGKTDKGNISYRYSSGGTATLQPLSSGDVLEYLADPTVIYPEAQDGDDGKDG